MPQTKERHREYMRERLSQPEKLKKYHQDRILRRRELRIWLLNIKSKHKCSRCSESDPCCLDFHHEGKKDFDVSTGIHQTKTKKRILEEIEKCVILCANCHRKEHKQEWYAAGET